MGILINMILIICIFLYSVTGSTVGDIYYNHYSNTQIVGEPFDYQLTLERAKHRCNSIHTCRAITKSINTDLYLLHTTIEFGSNDEIEMWKKGIIWAENFIPRVYWNASDPVGIENFPIPASSGVMGHHTNWDRCFNFESCSAEVKKIQDFHMGPQRNWWDIGYNFLIGEDGNIYEGRGFDGQGAHCTGWNTISYGFSMLGDFVEIIPNSNALDAAKQLIEHMKTNGYFNDCYG